MTNPFHHSMKHSTSKWRGNVALLLLFPLIIMVAFIQYHFTVDSSGDYDIKGAVLQNAGFDNQRSSFLPSQKFLDPFSDADAEIYVRHYAHLIRKYANELQEQFKLAENFSRKTRDSGIRCVGQIGRIEASMLYIWLREEKPKHVLEIGALCGSSTRWILAALAKNKAGKLSTFDLHDFPRMFIDTHTEQWQFYQEDMFQYIETSKGKSMLRELDFLFIDALHDNAFAMTYTQKLFAKVNKPAPVFCHDIFSPYQFPIFKECQQKMNWETIPEEMACIKRISEDYSRKNMGGRDVFYGPSQAGGEGPELLSWLSRTGRASGFVTFSPYAATKLTQLVSASFIQNGLLIGAMNNPAVFFQLQPMENPN